MKTFVTTGSCDPATNYMVNIDRQVGVAARMVEEGKYFCINHGRQYGKTTTLDALEKTLMQQGYAVFSLSFQNIDDDAFESKESLLFFTLRSMFVIYEDGANNLSQDSAALLEKVYESHNQQYYFDELLRIVKKINQKDKVVLIIDEVDEASNHPSFIKFLGLLRDMYLKRNKIPTFQSVVLAGVYDIKNLKLKMRPEEQHQYNSPWNIASRYDVDMSLPVEGIAAMLAEYKYDHGLDFDEKAIAQQLRDYTSGYPFLVSRLCQIIDENAYCWDGEGVLKAVNALLKEANTLFDDMVKKIREYPNLSRILQLILYSGSRVPYNYYEDSINLATMLNYVKEKDGAVAIYCRIFETWMYNYFSALTALEGFMDLGSFDKPKFTVGGRLNMRLILEKFVTHFNEIYAESDVKFLEKEGRKQFLLYLRPIINGVGNYYVEAETRDQTRADVVIDYLGQRYVVELKIWHGERYNEEGEQQLRDYLTYFQVTTGYLISFNFNQNKQPGVHEITLDGRQIIEAVV